jgi:predicted metal-binding protein
MKKVGIINCYKKSKECSGSGCFNSINNKIDSFERYSEEGFQLVGFGHCNECCKTSIKDISHRAESLKMAGADTIHISSCIKGMCPNYNKFIEILSKDYDVVEYTHANR